MGSIKTSLSRGVTAQEKRKTRSPGAHENLRAGSGATSNVKVTNLRSDDVGLGLNKSRLREN